MDLIEYGEILSNAIPTGASYIAMDKKYIMMFDARPQLVQLNGRTYTWRGATCLGWTKYWDTFIDTAPLLDPEENKIDWSLAYEKITPHPWKFPSTLQMWAEMLDRMLPYDSAYATINHDKLELWGKVPFYKNGEWLENGGRKPHATFYVPRNALINQKDVDSYRFL